MRDTIPPAWDRLPDLPPRRRIAVVPAFGLAEFLLLAGIAATVMVTVVVIFSLVAGQ